MNVKIANAMSGYIETLYLLNKSIIKLCGLDVISNSKDGHKEILDVVQNILRVVPYSCKSGNLCLKDGDGLLEYKNEIDYLEESYKEILEDNHGFLDKIRRIRNKHIHKMHGVQRSFCGSGSLHLFDFKFNIDNKQITVNAGEFLCLIKQVNKLYAKIVADISIFAYKNEKSSYPYYNKITRFDFQEFNAIYESDLLRKIGKILYDF